jgi:hypothetical protein
MKTRIFAPLLILIVILSLVASSSPASAASTTRYTVTITTSGFGSVSPDSPLTVNSGSTVTLTATPITGYKFDSWSGSISGTTNPISFKVRSDMTVKANFAASVLVQGLCEFYYGGYDTAQTQRILNAKPQFLVTETPGGSYGTYCPVDTIQANGTKIFSYVHVGYCSDYHWRGDTSDDSYSGVMGFIDTVDTEGCYGIFFDESPYSLYTGMSQSVSPTGTWAGHSLKEAIDKAHKKGLKVMLGIGSLGFSADLWAADYILSDENYTGRMPGTEELGHESNCVVIGAGVREATRAVTYTKNAWTNGFGFAYQCNSYGSMSSWFESYISKLGSGKP